MRLLDDLRDRYHGHFRVETGPHTPWERRKLRLGSATFTAGLAAWLLTGNIGWTLIAMVAVADALTEREKKSATAG